MTSYDYSAIPEELKALPQWVCWATDKLPRNPRTGGNAMSNNPSTWGTYVQAIEACEHYHWDGIGFMFAGGYFGVDLDGVYPDKQDLADEFLYTLGSYAEYSRSGKGLHIICRGTLPAGGRRKGSVEMYSEGRYFIMTGKQVGPEFSAIADCTESIKPLHAKHLGTNSAQAAPRPITEVSLDDRDIIDRARGCKSGIMFQALYDGNWQGAGYNSQSEADLALCNHLAFWTQKNATQIDRIFRSSGLMRDKWDRRQSGTTYGAITVQRACAGCGEVYDPSVHKDGYAVIIKPTARAPKRSDKVYAMTDTGNAERFADAYKDQLRYNHVHRCWYYWDGCKWERDFIGEAKRMADATLDQMRVEAYAIDDEDAQKQLYRHIDYTSSSKGKTSMIKEAEHRDGIPVLPEQMDADSTLLNVQNGVINLRNGELMPHSPALMMTRAGFAEYLPAAPKKPERWLAFLDEVTNGDKSLAEYLKRAVGYTLTGSIREQCAFFLYGGGSNGKSTFLDIVSLIMGSYASNAMAETLMVKQYSGGANSDLARLKSARMVISAEPSEGMRLNEGLIKLLTGGESITARFQYGSEFEFKPEFKLWIATNNKPIIRGTDDGIWRRVKLIPFTVHIPADKVDKMLKYKLREELPGILAWAVEGCLAWQKDGLHEPLCVTQASQEYRGDMDTLAAFIEACIERKTNGSLPASEIYSVYAKWADEGNEYKMSSQKFGREFAKRFQKRHTMNGWSYDGIDFSAYGRELKPYTVRIGKWKSV